MMEQLAVRMVRGRLSRSFAQLPCYLPCGLMPSILSERCKGYRLAVLLDVGMREPVTGHRR